MDLVNAVPAGANDTHNGAPLTIGLDIGGTNLRAGVVTAEGRIIDQMAFDTPSTPAEAEDAVVTLVDALGKKHEISAVGMAVAGFLDPECETVRFAPHLPWREAPLRRIMEDKLGLPVRLEHDANSAAWGEYRFGAGRGADTWVFFAVGTGIGATLFTNGAIYRGAFGTAPEFGHLTVVPGPEGRLCSCGKCGCLERYASGTALVDTAIELSGTVGASALAKAIADPSTAVTGHDVVLAARGGDALGVATLDEFGRWLGVGLSFVADVLDPELIVLGGGVSRDAELFLDRVSDVMASSVVGAGHRPLPRISTAELGAEAGMIGVADLARRS